MLAIGSLYTVCVAGFALLQKYNLTFDAWLFSSQLPDVYELAQAYPIRVRVRVRVTFMVGVGVRVGVGFGVGVRVRVRVRGRVRVRVRTIL